MNLSLMKFGTMHQQFRKIFFLLFQNRILVGRNPKKMFYIFFSLKKTNRRKVKLLKIDFQNS